jgi:asparagine synthase (glutamine-hydrolysing)
LALDLVRVLAAHSSVGLSGVGGDSLLWVSPWYWAGWLARGDVVRLWHAVQGQRRLFGDRLHPRLRRGLRRLITPPYTGRAPLPDWLSPAFAARTAAAQRTFGYRAHAAGFDARSLATDPFWSTMCQWGDPVSTRQAIKFRYPLLDLRLIEFVRGLPPEPWLRDKHVLREATVNRLPDVVRHRPKELLVNAPMPGQTEASPGRLIELLRQAPDLDCYIDIDAIVAHVTALGPVVDQASDQRLATTIGLAHWLTYR